jgi:hypothetical protein
LFDNVVIKFSISDVPMKLASPELFPFEVFAGEALLAEVEHICCYVLRLGAFSWGKSPSSMGNFP